MIVCGSFVATTQHKNNSEFHGHESTHLTGAFRVRIDVTAESGDESSGILCVRGVTSLAANLISRLDSAVIR